MAVVRVAIHPHIKDIPGIRELAVSFKSYKQDGVLPDNFGRDAGYDYPGTPHDVTNNLWHIHLAPSDKPFDPHTPQHQRTNPKGEPANDYILVYTKGFKNENDYMLMAILNPDGHSKQRDHLNVMIPLAEKAARDFRDKYWLQSDYSTV